MFVSADAVIEIKPNKILEVIYLLLSFINNITDLKIDHRNDSLWSLDGRWNMPRAVTDIRLSRTRLI